MTNFIEYGIVGGGGITQLEFLMLVMLLAPFYELFEGLGALYRLTRPKGKHYKESAKLF